MKFTTGCTLAALAVTALLTATTLAARSDAPAAGTQAAPQRAAGGPNAAHRSRPGHIDGKPPAPDPMSPQAGAVDPSEASWSEEYPLRPFYGLTACELRARFDGTTSFADVAVQQGKTAQQLDAFVARTFRDMTRPSAEGLPTRWAESRIAEFRRISRTDLPALGRCAAPAGVAQAMDLSQVGAPDEPIDELMIEFIHVIGSL